MWGLLVVRALVNGVSGGGGSESVGERGRDANKLKGMCLYRDTVLWKRKKPHNSASGD